MANQYPLHPLAKKKVTTQDFDRILKENLAKKQKGNQSSTDDSGWVDIPNDDNEGWTDIETPASPSQQVEDVPDEPGKLSKFLTAATTPLSGDYFQRKGKQVAEFMDDPNKEGFFKSTGKNDLNDKLAWLEASLRGGHRGLIEGTGAAIDQFTSPADLVATASGFGALGAASRGLRTVAKGLRTTTQLASAPVALQGGIGMKESGTDIYNKGLENFELEDLKRFGMSSFQAAAGAAGVHFPKSALTTRFPIELAPGSKSAPGVGKPQGPRQKISKPGGTSQSPTQLQQDPNLYNGVGDPELAGSGKRAPEAAPEFAPKQVQTAGDSGARLDELYRKIDDNTATAAEIAEADALQDVQIDAGIKTPKPAKPTEVTKEPEVDLEDSFHKSEKISSGETVNTQTGEITEGLDFPSYFGKEANTWTPEENAHYADWKAKKSPDYSSTLAEMSDARPKGRGESSEFPEYFDKRVHEWTPEENEHYKLWEMQQDAQGPADYKRSLDKIDEGIDARAAARPPSPEIAQLQGFMTDVKDLSNIKHPTQSDLSRLDTLKNRVKNFMSEDKGELDTDALSDAYSRMFKKEPVHDPVLEAQKLRDNDPNQPLRSEFAHDWEDFNADGSPERMYQGFGGESHKSHMSGRSLDERGYPRPASEPPPHKFFDKVKNFMGDDEGSFDLDVFSKRRKAKAKEPLPPPTDWANMSGEETAALYTREASAKRLAAFDPAEVVEFPKSFGQRFKESMSDEQGSVPRAPRQQTKSQEWKNKIAGLEAENAPDLAYKELFSTAARDPLKKGDTWKAYANRAAEYFAKNEKPLPRPAYKPMELEPEVVPDVPEIAAEVPAAVPETIPAAVPKLIRPGQEPLAASSAAAVPPAKIPRGQKPKYRLEPDGTYTLLSDGSVKAPVPTADPVFKGANKRTKTPVETFPEEPIIESSSNALANAHSAPLVELPEKTAPGMTQNSPNAEALFGRGKGDLNLLTREKVQMGYRNATDAEYQRLIPESLRFKLADGETWRKRLTELLKGARERDNAGKIPLGEDNTQAFDPDAFSAAKNDPQVVEALQTINVLKDELKQTNNKPGEQQRAQELNNEIERQTTVISRVVSKIKAFMSQDSGEFDADALIGKPKVHEPQLVDDMPSSLKSPQSRIAAGEKIVEWDQTGTNMLGNESVLVRNLNGPGQDGYTTPTNARLIEDSSRMQDKRIRQNNDPKWVADQKAKSDDWNRVQDNLEATNRVEKKHGRGGGNLSKEDYNAIHAEELTGVHSERGRVIAESAPKKRLAEHVKNFMSDEEGSINFDKLFGERQKVSEEPRGTSLGLKGFSELQQGKDIISRQEPVAPEQGWLGKAKDIPKGTMSVDLPYITSAAFRQVKPLAWSSEWFKAWGQAAKAYGDEAAAQAIDKQIKNSKNFKPRYKPVLNNKGEVLRYKEMPSIAESIGVHLSGSKFLPGEEHYRAQLAEKLPWVRPSNRAYQTFVNHMRQTKLDELLEQMDASGNKNNTMLAKEIGDFVNTATGRGSLKWEGPGGRKLDLERIAPILQNTMWAPRLLAANTKFLNPYTYKNANPMVRRQYTASALRMAGTWIGFAGLAKAAGADVSLDPTSSDFGKIRIGDTRVDPAGGMQQLIVYLARQLPKKVGEWGGFETGSFMSSGSGKRKEYGEGAFPVDRASVTEDFMTSKLDPVTRLAYELMRSTNKRPVHLGDKAVQMALPIMAQDIMDAMKEDPSLERLLGSSFLSSAGMGVNTYGKGERFSDPVFTDSIEGAMGLDKRSLAGTIGKW